MAEVKIEITAQDNASGVFKNIQSANSSALNQMSAETRNYTESSKSLVTSLKEHWVAASVAVYGAWRLIQEGLDLAKLGAHAQQAEESFRTVVASYGEDADVLLSKMKEASRGLIDDSDLMQRAVKGLMSGADSSQLVTQLQYASYGARIAATSVADAYDIATNALSNQMLRGEKVVGLQGDLNKAFTEEAEKLGTVAGALNETTQTHALFAQAGEDAIQKMKIMGPLTENAAEKFQKMQVQVTELKETIGKGLVVVLETVGALFYSVATGALYLAGAFATVGQGLDYIAGNLGGAEKLRDIANNLFGAAAETNKKAETMWKAVGAAIEGATSKINNAAAAQLKSDQTAKQQADSLNLLKDKIKEANTSVEEFGKKMGDLAPDLNETSKKVADVTQEVQKMKQTLLQNVGQNVLDQLAPQIDAAAAAGISNIYKQQLKDFDDLMTGMSTARKEGITKDLAEIDKSLADETKKFGNNSVMMTAIAQAEDLKRIDSLKKWKDSLISMHNEAIDKAREYYKTVEDLNLELSKGTIFLDQWKKGFPSDQKSVFEKSRQDLQLMIDMANNNPTLQNLQSAKSAIESFAQQNDPLRTTLIDTPGKGLQPIWKDSDVAKMQDQYASIQTSIAGVKDATQTLGDSSMTTAMKFIDIIKPIDQAMDLLKSRVTDYIDMISIQRQVTLDTSPAVDSLQALITKTTEALGYIQQLDRYNTFSTSAMSGLAPSAPAAEVAPPENVPVMAGGTPYVRKAGYAWVDPGERVMTADQNRAYSGGGKQSSVSFGDIKISIQGVNDVEEIARKIAIPLQKRFRELNHLLGGN